MLLAVDTLVGALKPMKSDVAPLHYHAGVVWCAAARRVPCCVTAVHVCSILPHLSLKENERVVLACMVQGGIL